MKTFILILWMSSLNGKAITTVEVDGANACEFAGKQFVLSLHTRERSAAGYACAPKTLFVTERK